MAHINEMFTMQFKRDFAAEDDDSARDVVRNVLVNCDDIHMTEVTFRSIAFRNSVMDDWTGMEDVKPGGPREPSLLINQYE